MSLVLKVDKTGLSGRILFCEYQEIKYTIAVSVEYLMFPVISKMVWAVSYCFKIERVQSYLSTALCLSTGNSGDFPPQPLGRRYSQEENLHVRGSWSKVV